MQNPMQSSAQVSTTTLLNALHNAYSSGQPYPLEPSTSLVVNTWVSASQTGADGRVGGTVDVELARRSWEHARRRAEDSAIVLGYVMDKQFKDIFGSILIALQIIAPINTFASRAFRLCLAALRTRHFLHSS